MGDEEIDEAVKKKGRKYTVYWDGMRLNCDSEIRKRNYWESKTIANS